MWARRTPARFVPSGWKLLSVPAMRLILEAVLQVREWRIHKVLEGAMIDSRKDRITVHGQSPFRAAGGRKR